MKLEYKPDFDAAAAQWTRFWRGEHTRPCVMAVLPKPGVKPVDKPRFAAGATGDFEPVIDQALRWAETHEFLGDAIPFFYLEFAAEHFATLLGADLRFSETEPGGWTVPCLVDLASAEIRFEREGKWWKRTAEFAQAIRSRCDGRLLIACNTLAGNLDALAALCGTEKLLLAMIEDPDSVHRALDQIDRAHAEILDTFSGLLDYDRFGSINRHGFYSSGRINVQQCDFSCMIGPGMFREFAVPYLTREMRRFDAVEYHLDGPGALKHLETLCAIEELEVIQWVPGAGPGEQQDWTALFDRIDSLGKGQWRGGRPAEVKRLWQKYGRRKMVFTLHAQSRAEVEDCLAELEQLR
jgi:hypothetical protein